MASEIYLAGREHQYRDPEDGDYINSLTELLYLPDTDEFRLDERESYLYGGATLRSDSTPISKEDALDFIDECANDRSLYHGVEMAPDEEIPAAHSSDSEQASEIIDNLRRKVENERSDAERKEDTMPEQTKSNIRIKDPDAPASGAQMGLLNSLAENGVVTPEEMAALGDSPTKQAARDLINAHAEEEGFKAVQEARRAQRAAAKSRSPEQDGQPSQYAHVKVPAAFVKPYTYTAKDGRTFEKAYVRLAQGTKVNGIDIGGFSCDVFMNDHMKKQVLADQQVGLSFKADEPVAIWKGSKDDPEHPYERYEVNPWALVKGIKDEFENYKADKAAEREAAKGQGISLKDMEETNRDSADALAGHDAQDDRLPETR